MIAGSGEAAPGPDFFDLQPTTADMVLHASMFFRADVSLLRMAPVGTLFPPLSASISITHAFFASVPGMPSSGLGQRYRYDCCRRKQADDAEY